MRYARFIAVLNRRTDPKPAANATSLIGSDVSVISVRAKWMRREGRDSRRPADDDIVSYFMRCRLHGRSWTKCWTRDETQPPDGFTVPAKLSDGEVEILCEAYEKMDPDGRELIRATAAQAA